MTVSVREMTVDDAETVAGWLNLERVRKYLSSNLRGGTMQPGLVRAALRRPDQHWFVFTVDGEPAGAIVLDTIDETDGLANCWYLLGDERFLGKGHTGTALKAVLDANPAGLHCVTAWCGAPNEASIRCLQSAGFCPVGSYTGAFVVDGKRSDRLLFERVLDPC